MQEYAKKFLKLFFNMEVSLNLFTSQSGLVFQNHPFQAFFVSKTYILVVYIRTHVKKRRTKCPLKP